MRIATTLLASCALLLSIPAISQAPPNLTRNCQKTATAACEVTVIVPANCGGGGVHVAPEPLVLGNQDREITWTIRSSGEWQFDNGGVTIWDGGKSFTANPRGGNSDKFVLKRANAAEKPVVYKYDINLVIPKTGQKCKHDPTIVDQ